MPLLHRFTEVRIAALCLALAVLAAAGSAQAYQTERVVIVVIDGPRDTETFEHPLHPYVPRMWNDLRPQGFVSHAFYNVGRTQTISGHSTIGSGTLQDLANDGSERSTRPLLWEYLRDQTGIPARSCVVVTAKSKLLSLSYSTFPGYGAADSAYVIGPTWNDGLSLQRLIAHMTTYTPRLSLISFSAPDGAGHAGDWFAYLDAIAYSDSLTHRLWTWLQSNPAYAGRTAMFVTSDHGRHRIDWTDHGDDCDGCRHLPFLALGPDFVTGMEVVSPTADQRDIARTAAVLLGIDMPYGDGRFMTELFRDPAAIPQDVAGNAAGALQIWPLPARDAAWIRVGSAAAEEEWLASFFDPQGRRLSEVAVTGDRLVAGFPLARPSDWPGRGVTYLQLRRLGSHEAPRTRTVVWTP